MKIPLFIFLAFFLFLGLFFSKSYLTMKNTPFYDFDEAHRAENARTMKSYNTFIVPLSGSPFDRNENLKIHVRNSNNFYLYYHLERPPFVYWLMIISTSILGSEEFAYRLPSFIFGMLTIGAFYVFTRKISFKSSAWIFSFSLGFLALMTSQDLWLSSQYAQLDTALTFFLFLSLMLLILYCSKKNMKILFFAGLSFGFGVLSKGQPAVVFIFPLLFLLITKRIKYKEIFIFILSSLVVLFPWIFLLTLKFGSLQVIEIFSEFAIFSSISKYLHIYAPFYWYLRWWWESLRPAWTLFISLLVLDILNDKLNWKKGFLLSYILSSLLFFSLAVNKIWWYVLPLIPPLSFYIYLSISDYLKNNRRKLINLSVVLILDSLPIFFGLRNIFVLIYGLFSIILTCLILKNNNLPSDLIRHTRKFRMKISNIEVELIYFIALIFCLVLFYLRFPKIIPYHWETKEVAQYYSNLAGIKCLWLYDMPSEAALFYSKAEQISPLTPGKLQPNCDDYLITPTDDKERVITPFFPDAKLIFESGKMKLFKLDKNDTNI